MRKLIIGFLAFALICVTGFFVVIGVLGGMYAGMCLSSDAAKLEGNDNQAKIYNYWVKNGFSAAQAAGITASIKHESGYSPFRQEMSQSWPAGGYGIAQFTGGQRRAVTEHMAKVIGADFNTYYSPAYGGAVRAEDGYIPTGISEEINDIFLAAQLAYLTEYMSSFKPSSIPLRTRGFQSLTGLSVPQDATLDQYMRSLDSADAAAKAWTFLYEFPGNINSTAIARGKSAEELRAHVASLAGDPESAEQAGFIKGACGGGDIVAPVEGENLIVTSGSDIRTRTSGITRMHEGIDIIGGERIVAMMSGTVEVAQNNYYGYGTAVKIDHGNGTFSLYGHLVHDSLAVKPGDRVDGGQYLGKMGNTGDSEGVHLHFQVWVDDKLYNAFPFLVEHGVKLTWAASAYPRNETPGPIYDRDR